MLLRDLYIGGQSYAQRYTTELAYRIHQDLPTTGIPLKGVYVGGPAFNMLFEHIFELPFALGAFSHNDVVLCNLAAKRHIRDPERDDPVWKRCWYRVWLMPFYNFVTDEWGVHDTGLYDDEKYMNYTLSLPSMKLAIHVGSKQFNNINFHSLQRHALLQDMLIWGKDKLAVLLDNYKVLIYNGDYDVITSTIGIEKHILSTPWSLQTEYKSSSRYVWRLDDHVSNLSVTEFWNLSKHGTFQGFYTKVGNFCRVVVHGAGHQVPHDQPEVSLRMMEEFVYRGCVGNLTGNHYSSGVYLVKAVMTPIILTFVVCLYVVASSCWAKVW